MNDPMAQALAAAIAEAVLDEHASLTALRADVAQLRQIAGQTQAWAEKAEAEVVLLRQELVMTDARLAALMAALRALEQDMRAEAKECRLYAGVPCQREHTWHADLYEEWADSIAVLRTPKATP